MATSKYNAKPTANWEKNMSKLGTPVKKTTAKPTAAKSSSSKSTTNKPTAASPKSNYPSPQAAPLPKGNALLEKKVPSKAMAPKSSTPKLTPKANTKKNTTTGKIVKAVIDRANKYPSKPASTKPSTSSTKIAPAPSKTVSQIWKEKTGMDWSEAKKRGLSDGSAKSNLALLAKLKSGEVSKSSLSKPVASTPAPTPSAPAAKMTPTGGSGIGATEREPDTYRRGGSVKKKKK